MRITFLPLRALAAIATVVAVAACGAESGTVTGANHSPGAIVIDLGAGDGQPSMESIEVCKYGSTASVYLEMQQTINSVPTNTSGTFSLQDATGVPSNCRKIGQFDGRSPATLSLNEVIGSIPSGFKFDSLRYTVITGTIGDPSTWVVDAPVLSTTNSFNWANADNHIGFLVEFFNSEIPPPPPGGGEGCTPGYWKQEQHFDSWTSPYTPSMLFKDAGFEDAFHDMTLLQVVQQGGGGLKALGRHTVAALLNTASAGVDYDLTTQGVLDAFNAVYPGGDYEGQKNIFAGYNELGCPLN